MKILFINNIPAPYKIDFFNQLAKKEDITVIFERRKAKDRQWNEENMHFKHFFLKGINYGNESSISFGLVWHLISNKYELIVLGGYSSITSILTIIYLRLRGIKFAYALDGAIYKENFVIKKIIKKFLIKSADIYFSTSDGTDQYLEKFNVQKNKIYRTRLSSVRYRDIIKIKDKEKKRAYKLNFGVETEYMILAVGQFIKRKGFDVLLRSIKGLKQDLTLCIVGGEVNDEYKKIIKDNNLNNVNFYNFLSKEKLKECYKAADLFVMPTREDIWGLVILEAMSYSLPVISTDKCEAANQMYREGAGISIVEADNHDAISERINDILNDCDLMNDMSIKSNHLIKYHTLEEMVENYTYIFKNLELNNK